MDLSKLSIDELKALNKAVCAEVKQRYDVKASEAAVAFRIGSVVCFDRGRFPFGTLTGVIDKINRKTARVIVEGGQPWKVSLTLLRTV